MLIALAFAHFLSELLLKEQMIIPVKRTLNAGHIDAKLIDFREICQKKKTNEIGCFFTDCFLGKFPPEISREIGRFFLRIYPWKSFKIWLFSAKIPQNRPIFLWILTFLLQKSCEIGRFSANFDFFPAKIPQNRPIFPRICPRKSRKISLFFLQNIRSPAHYFAYW